VAASSLQHVVFVWDVEGCLLLLHSLVTGEYAAAQGRDAAHGASLGRRAQSLLLQLLDDHMHFSKVCARHDGAWCLPLLLL
jgi:hypothetical protein